MKLFIVSKFLICFQFLSAAADIFIFLSCVSDSIEMNSCAVILWDLDGVPVPRGRDLITTLNLMEQAVFKLGFYLLPFPCRSIMAFSEKFWIHETADPRLSCLNSNNPAIYAPFRRYAGLNQLLQNLIPKNYWVGLVVLVSGNGGFSRNLESLRRLGYLVCVWYPQGSHEGGRMSMDAEYRDTWEATVGAPVQEVIVEAPVQEVQAPVQEVQAPVQEVQTEEADWCIIL